METFRLYVFYGDTPQRFDGNSLHNLLVQGQKELNKGAFAFEVYEAETGALIERREYPGN